MSGVDVNDQRGRMDSVSKLRGEKARQLCLSKESGQVSEASEIA